LFSKAFTIAINAGNYIYIICHGFNFLVVIVVMVLVVTITADEIDSKSLALRLAHDKKFTCSSLPMGYSYSLSRPIHK
jgi:hypothetical protein